MGYKLHRTHYTGLLHKSCATSNCLTLHLSKTLETTLCSELHPGSTGQPGPHKKTYLLLADLYSDAAQGPPSSLLGISEQDLNFQLLIVPLLSLTHPRNDIVVVSAGINAVLEGEAGGISQKQRPTFYGDVSLGGMCVGRQKH